MNFERVSPESVGISSFNLKRFAERLEEYEIPMHSIIVGRGDYICMETYYAPFKEDTQHRMFSITKSFVALGIGLLCEEGKLNLDDRIVDYFPEKLPPEGAHPYLRMLTIRQMLAMNTCHEKNTYKVSDTEDWLGSFFTVKPTHVPGTYFIYDTASTHVLCGLIEKLSGMNALDYLREKCLNEIGFSKEAEILKDPSGSQTMGGSGLCATPMDIYKVLYLVARKGEYNGKQLLPRDFIELATSPQSENYTRTETLEEMQGYGYQIWLTRNNGFVMYGMGGQLAMYLPDKDMFMVTTADTQGKKDGVQHIYDAFFEEVYVNALTELENEPLEYELDAIEEVAFEDLKDFEKTRELFVFKGICDDGIKSKLDGKLIEFLEDNVFGMKQMRLSFNGDKAGSLEYVNASGAHSISFGIGYNEFIKFPVYDFKCAVSAGFRHGNTFVIKVQIIDKFLGNIYISFGVNGEYVTVAMRKLEETYFKEFNGIASGKIG